MYRAFYRKYRPQTFTHVVGQEHITKTLLNAVKTGKTSHAYLFTGSRGTGKTSCAKILSKAVNCPNAVDGNPCNECEICKGIDDGSILDIIEIDAASNNGVDNIRDLREEANFTPTKTKYRVYIIDEVHMLSIGAFNALLKTLEEPPAHVIFILATTEVHKIPSTILSRCQRFDFKRIPPESIAERLKLVAEKENLQLSDDGAMLIARIADGAMRDALSLLDRCSSYEGVIDSTVVADSAGLAGREHIFALCDCILNEDTPKALETINTLYNDSCDMERLLLELTNHYRNLMVSKAIKDFRDMIICSENELEIIKRQSESTTLATIMRGIDVLTEATANMKQGANRRTVAELSIIRLCTPSLDTDINSLLDRISKLEKALSDGVKIPVKSTEKIVNTVSESLPKEELKDEQKENVQNSEPQKPSTVTETPPVREEKTTQKVLNPTGGQDTVPFQSWPEVLDTLFSKDKSLIVMLQGSSAFVHKDKYLLIKGSPVLEMYLKTGDYSQKIKQAVAEVTGRNYTLAVYNNKQETSPKSPLQNLVNRAKELGVEIKEEK